MPDTIDVVDCYKLGGYKLYFELIPLAWQGFNLNQYANNNWSKFKYLNDNCSDINTLINNVPNNIGGIYIFYVCGNVIPDIHNYIVYIGRAQHTVGQNLRKRCKEYWQKYTAKSETRMKIELMMKLYRDVLHIMFLPLDDNENIIQLEAELVKAIRPPFNDDIPRIIFEAPVSAFNH
jgi:hypothetical protein